ncbi:MAG: carbon-nitrogen hydrolase family protein [Enterobacterales bacterium]|nr:carbon-nitrogen hydrolase family protein [Enterobacterales bacterium]
MAKIAIVQQAPVFLDKQKSILKAVELVEKTAKQGAKLVVFTEAFIPGYPAWVWRLRPGSDMGLSAELHSRLLKNAVDLDSDDLQPLYGAAKKHQITIVCGIHERDNELTRSTLYNCVITISDKGELINRHRKLMPTNPERMVWGFGDASGLRVIDTPVGRIGSLICWENFMPLARYALYAQGVEIYIAPTYDSGDNWMGSLQHIAREGGCWVLGSCNLINESDLPQYFPEKESLYPEKNGWINGGGSAVIAPDGKIVAGPMINESGILYYDIDLEKAANAKRAFDVAGHYSRPDIFNLEVNNKPQSSISFK